MAVLAALGVDAGTEESRAAALWPTTRRYWSRSLPPTIVGRAGSRDDVLGPRHATATRRTSGSGSRTARSAPGVRQADNFTPPFDLDGRLVGEATFVLPADLPLGYHRVHLRSGGLETSTALIITPAWLGLPARLGARRAWGLATQLYSVRSKNSWGVGDLGRSHRSGGVGRGAPRRGIRAGQSVARGRAHQADGALPLPADVAALHQSALPAGRGDPRVRLSAQAQPGLEAARRGPGAGPQGRLHRPGCRRGRPNALR